MLLSMLPTFDGSEGNVRSRKQCIVEIGKKQTHVYHPPCKQDFRVVRISMNQGMDLLPFHCKVKWESEKQTLHADDGGSNCLSHNAIEEM